jgi:hypothetical protein
MAFMRGKGFHIQLQPQVEEGGKGLYASGGGLYASGGSGLYAAGGPQKQVTRRQMHHSVLSDATLALHQADLMSAQLIQKQITARKQLNQHEGEIVGEGLHHPRFRRPQQKLVEGGSIGIHGSLLRGSQMPQALQSQPYSQNYQFKSFLPPAFQGIHTQGK